VSIDCLDTRSARRVLARSARLAHHVERTARSGARASGRIKGEGISPDLLFLLVPEDRVTKIDCISSLRPERPIRRSAATPRAWCHRGRRRQSPECTWVVLGDPEGNEFCVLRPFTDEEMASFA